MTLFFLFVILLIVITGGDILDSISYYASVSTDKGYVRANNEDNIFFIGTYLTAENRDEGMHISGIHENKLLLYGIFDGMGGTEFGEEASLIASTVADEYYSAVADTGVDNLDEFITNIIQTANRKVCDKMREINSGRMGSTVAFVALYGNKAKIYNVGDSRVYIQKNNVLKQISLDDSFAQRLFRLGVISAEEAKVHKDRNKLVQHLGIDENELIIEPHISEEIEIYPGDRILLCSDGLTDMVTDERINQILMSGETIDHKSEELLCEALTNGGRDNISIILLEQFIPVEEPEVYKEVHENKKSYLGFIIALIITIVIAIGVFVYSCICWLTPDAKTTSNEKQNVSSQNNEKIQKIQHTKAIALEPEGEFYLTDIIREHKLAKDCSCTSSDNSIVIVKKDKSIEAVESGMANITLKDKHKEVTVKVIVSQSGKSHQKNLGFEFPLD